MDLRSDAVELLDHSSSSRASSSSSGDDVSSARRRASSAAADAAFVGPARCAASRVATPRMGSTADFKTGLTIEFEDQVWKVTEFLHVKPGKGSAFVRSKLKNLQTGQTLEKTWKAGEQFPDAQVDRESMMYSYLDEDDNFVFMNMETYERRKSRRTASTRRTSSRER